MSDRDRLAEIKRWYRSVAEDCRAEERQTPRHYGWLISELEQARERIAELERQGLKLVMAEALAKSERDETVADRDRLQAEVERLKNMTGVLKAAMTDDEKLMLFQGPAALVVSVGMALAVLL